MSGRCEECGQVIELPRTWSVVIDGVRFGGGQLRAAVLGEELTQEEAERIRATGFKAQAVSDKAVSDRAWRAPRL